MRVSKFIACLTFLIVIQVQAQQPFWRQTSGYSFQKVWITTLQFNSQGQLFAACRISFNYTSLDTVQTGVLLSNDNGAAWVPTGLTYTSTHFGNYNGVKALIITSAGHIFAASDDSKIFRSINNGISWIEVISGINVDDRALVSNSSGHIFAGGGNGVFRSLDNGQSWSQKNNGLGNTKVHSLAISSDGVIFAGTDAGTYRSTNNGESWTGGGTVTVIGLAINSINGYIFAATNLGIYRSTDSGQNWTNVGFPNSLTRTVSVNPNGEVYISTGGPHSFGEVYRSKDNGATWTKIHTEHATCFAFSSSGRIFFGTEGAGMYRSTDNGNTWVRPWITDAWVLSLSSASDGSVFAGTLGNYVFRTTNAGNSWTQLTNGLTNDRIISVAINPVGYVFAGTDSGGIYRSTDNGQTWIQTNNGIGNNTYVFAFAFDPSGNILAGCNPTSNTGGGIYISTNSGATWSLLTSTSGNVYSLATASGGRIFAGTNDGKVYVSLDNGATWTSSSLTNTTVRSLALNAQGDVFAGTDYPGGLYRSTNNGAIWSNLGFTNTSVTSIITNPIAGMFIGTWGRGVYRSTNNGLSWAEVNDGLQDYNVLSLALDPAGYLYCGTRAGGVFRSNQSLTTSVEQLASELPTEFLLYKNYPNPFNPSTTIQFALPKRTFVRLIIFNVLGEQVETLVETEMEAGIHNVIWNAAKYASGIYFYRLEANQFIQTRKLVLLK